MGWEVGARPPTTRPRAWRVRLPTPDASGRNSASSRTPGTSPLTCSADGSVGTRRRGSWLADSIVHDAEDTFPILNPTGKREHSHNFAKRCLHELPLFNFHRVVIVDG